MVLLCICVFVDDFMCTVVCCVVGFCAFSQKALLDGVDGGLLELPMFSEWM